MVVRDVELEAIVDEIVEFEAIFLDMPLVEKEKVHKCNH